MSSNIQNRKDRSTSREKQREKFKSSGICNVCETYAGIYSGDLLRGTLQRDADGQQLSLKRSQRAGMPPHFLRDVTAGTYLSSLYTEHTHPQFETPRPCRARYEIQELEVGTYRIRLLRGCA
jgi:hypothetical protein